MNESLLDADEAARRLTITRVEQTDEIRGHVLHSKT